MAECTKAELLLANEQVLAATETRLAELKKGGALEAAYEATEDVAIELACQRNRALAALKLERTRLSKTVAYQNGYMEAENAMDDLGAAIAACTEAK